MAGLTWDLTGNRFWILGNEKYHVGLDIVYSHQVVNDNAGSCIIKLLFIMQSNLLTEWQTFDSPGYLTVQRWQ